MKSGSASIPRNIPCPNKFLAAPLSSNPADVHKLKPNNLRLAKTKQNVLMEFRGFSEANWLDRPGEILAIKNYSEQNH